MERSGGPEPVDYLGLAADRGGPRARTAVLRFADRHAGAPVPVLHVGVSGGRPLRLQDVDRNRARQRTHHRVRYISGTNDRAPITIWVDGRPDASRYAIHPIGGYATGVWEGDVLAARITHMKEGYLRRNGSPTSDESQSDASPSSGTATCWWSSPNSRTPIYLERAAGPQQELRPGHGSHPPDRLALRAGRRGEPGSGRRSPLPTRQEPVHRRDDQGLQRPARSGVRRRGDALSGVPQEAQG